MDLTSTNGIGRSMSRWIVRMETEGGTKTAKSFDEFGLVIMWMKQFSDGIMYKIDKVN
jgi:hypothetical protein